MRVIPRIPIVGAMLVSTNVTSAGDPAPYDASATYGLDSATATVRVTDPATNLVYRSRVKDNKGNAPAASTTQWQLVGYTNARRMFGQRVSAQTTRADLIEVQFKPGEFFDALELLNLDADSVQVIVTDPLDGVQFDQTQSLVIDDVADYFEYCFTPIRLRTKALFVDLPPYPDATITVRIARPGGLAACGPCVVGASLVPGDVEWGMEMGLDDYSVKSQNEFGLEDLNERPFSDLMNCTVVVPWGMSTSFTQLLQRLRATPAVYVAADHQPDTAIYGWPETWRRLFPRVGEDVYSISFKALT